MLGRDHVFDHGLRCAQMADPSGRAADFLLPNSRQSFGSVSTTLAQNPDYTEKAIVTPFLTCP